MTKELINLLTDLGITVSDSNGEMKSLGNVLEEMQSIWTKLDEGQRSKAVAILIDNSCNSVS